METFPAVAAEVLSTFQALLEHSPPPIGSTRLLQLMAINMFAVHNSQPKGTGGTVGEMAQALHLRGARSWPVLPSPCLAGRDPYARDSNQERAEFQEPPLFWQFWVLSVPYPSCV